MAFVPPFRPDCTVALLPDELWCCNQAFLSVRFSISGHELLLVFVVFLLAHSDIHILSERTGERYSVITVQH